MIEGMGFDADDLKRLTLRAAIAFAVRCAQRVSPLTIYPDTHETAKEDLSRLSDAIRLAESVASGAEIDSTTMLLAVNYAALAVRDAQNVSEVVLLSAQSVFAAAQAASAVLRRASTHTDAYHLAFSAAQSSFFTYYSSDDMAKAMSKDLALLLERSFGRFLELGEGIDLKDLGPLWADDEPAWFTCCHRVAQVERIVRASHPSPLISVVFDRNKVSDDDIQLFLSYLGEIYRSIGGAGLKIAHSRVLSPELV